MAKIQIRRSKTTAAPTTLANGELAYSFQSKKLFIGNDAGAIEEIGGDGAYATMSEVSTAITGAIDTIDGGTF